MRRLSLLPSLGNNLVDATGSGVNDDPDPSGYPTRMLRLVHSPGAPPEERHTLAVVAYFDASGDRDTSVVSVAGFVGTDEQWTRFTALWNDCLKEWGLMEPGMPGYFHMTDYVARRWPYDDEFWTDEETRKERLGRLLTLIVEHVALSVGTVIPVAQYRETVAPSVDELMGGPFGMGAAACLLDLGDLMRPLGEWVSVIFERGDTGWGKVRGTYERLTRNDQFRQYARIEAMADGDKRRFPPLQAADILAYELFRRVQTQLGLNESARRTYPLSVLAMRPNAWVHLRGGALRDWSEALSMNIDGLSLNVKPDGGLELHRPDGSVWTRESESEMPR